ncbi:MAG: hypothetical protein SGPRY_004609 [Prymnesium sp.]
MHPRAQSSARGYFNARVPLGEGVERMVRREISLLERRLRQEQERNVAAALQAAEKRVQQRCAELANDLAIKMGGAIWSDISEGELTSSPLKCDPFHSLSWFMYPVSPGVAMAVKETSASTSHVSPSLRFEPARSGTAEEEEEEMDALIASRIKQATRGGVDLRKIARDQFPELATTKEVVISQDVNHRSAGDGTQQGDKSQVGVWLQAD